MLKKLTITIDADLYDGLHRVIGRRRISRFLNDLARPLVLQQDLAAGYAAMAADTAREAEADAWTEALLPDTAARAPTPSRAAGRSGWSPSIPQSASKSRRPGPPSWPATTPRTRFSTASRWSRFPVSSARLYPAEAAVRVLGEPRKAMADQLATISKRRLQRRLDPEGLEAVLRAIRAQLGL